MKKEDEGIGDKKVEGSKVENYEKLETKKDDSKCADSIKEADKNSQGQNEVSKPKYINVSVFKFGSEVQNNVFEGNNSHKKRSNIN